MIVRHPDGTASVTSTGRMSVKIEEVTSGLPATEVDVSGFVERTGRMSSSIPPSFIRPSRISRHAQSGLRSPARVMLDPAIGTIAGDRASFRRGRRGFPVQFRGVVTYWMKPRNFVFVQDSTAGIFMVQRLPCGARPAGGRQWRNRGRRFRAHHR